ncbi:MAG: HAD family phosphatase [Patescibacteria group bacterium]|nr:HAD-IB family hydrolase [Patescibacteria group bacterium]MDE1966186.1 HAD family phosphatase [Patescibacteria group bacterium]
MPTVRKEREPKKRPVAVFDIDGTVFRSSLTLELVERLIEKRIFAAESREKYERERERWLDRKGDYQEYVNKVVEVFVSQIKGVPYAAVADAAGEIIEEKKNRVYRYTRDLIKKLKREGYYLLAVSHSPKFIVDGFGYEAGFDKVYGFFFASGASGNFTGEVEDEDVIRNKQAVLQRAVRKENLALEGSIGVGDTESDIPLLESVETAIAFNPNQLLYRHAKRRGWKIVVERKDVIYEL